MSTFRDICIGEIKNELLDLADVFVAAIIRNDSPAKDELSTRQAYLKYGREWVRYHEERGTIKGRKKGKHTNSPVVHSNLELLALKEAEKRGARMVRRTKN